APRTAFVIDHIARQLFDEIGLRPSDRDVREEIAEALQRWSLSGAADDESDPSQPPEFQIYSRLREWGWIEEIQDGFRKTVDMPVAARDVLEFVRSFKARSRGYSSQVQIIKQTLQSVLGGVRFGVDTRQIRERADTLIDVAMIAEDMRKHFRNVFSECLRYERKLMTEPDLKEVVKTYFTEYVATTLVNDWSILNTSQSPFRFKPEIIELCSEWDMWEPNGRRFELAQALIDKNRAKDHAEAIELVEISLSKIRLAFDDAEVL
ncbi:Wadjet anti-phage system protein JetA family protein, partial [Nostoc sp. NIES-2111]